MTYSSINYITLPFIHLIAALFIAATTADVPKHATPVTLGKVDSPLITEASGLAASRCNDGILYTHNDSGDSARVFAIDHHAHLVAILELSNISVIDCEDIAIGPSSESGGNYIYLGDIGDNDRKRKTIVVYRFAEPTLEIDEVRNSENGAKDEQRVVMVEEIESFVMRYEDGPHNAEALMIDPLTGDLFIATKQVGSTAIYVARSETLKPDTTITLHAVATVQLGGVHSVTAGDISPDGTSIILRSYWAAIGWTRTESSIGKITFEQQRYSVATASEQQGEAICFDHDNGGYYTLSEGVNQSLYYFERVKSDTRDDTGE